ncbi:MAG: hypothetical protein NC400_10185 [Clostridium sp.]|nr:hypothetical protein [Clostridium sp.]
MKRHVKLFSLLSFVVILCVIFAISKNQEHNRIFGCPVITEDQAVSMLAEKNPIDAAPELLYFQEQLIPYRSDLNTFLLPVADFGTAAGNISCAGGRTIYFVLEENWELDKVCNDASPLSVYIIDNTSYIETSITLTTSTILTFQTSEFENSNAYGEMKLYTPADKEINMYSYKHSEAKLSYEELEGMLPPQERNYKLKLFKNGIKNKMNLAGLSKDDDWELDSLLNYTPQILQFYEEWNNFCIDKNEERFIVQFQIIELYIDGQFMGDYLLRVPFDNKRQNIQGTWLTDANKESAIYSSQIQEIYNEIIPDSILHMEYYFLQEKNNDALYAIPRKFSRLVEASEQY